MAFSDKEKNSKKTQDKREQKGNGSEGEFSASGIPNSLMLQMFADGDDNNNNNSGATVFREFSLPTHQIPSAEAEADRLSAGIHGTDPAAVRREMGHRLNADLSGIRFHSDLRSEARASQMGARAWTSGRDVYFGKGGFEPRVAAHELVHTVQQGAAKGKVSQNVTAGTVQMWSWWPFGRKKSKYDEEQDAGDIADTLFRIQAGFSASDEAEKAARDTAYAKAYNNELNQRDGINVPGNNDELDEEVARNAGQAAADRLRVKRKDYVSNKDKDNFRQKINTINKETYKELLDRRKQAAKELCDSFDEISAKSVESFSKNYYAAANSKAGRDYILYNKLVTRIEAVHQNRRQFRNWKNEFENEEQDQDDTLEKANRIISEGNSTENSYLKTAEGIQQRGENAGTNTEYYQKVYGKKKTKLDRIAAVYRRRLQRNAPQEIEIENIDKIEDSDNDSEHPGLLSNAGSSDGSGDFILEGLPKESEKKKPSSRNIRNENIISNNIIENDDESSIFEKGMKEKDDESSISEYGMKESDNNNIISTSSKDQNKDENGGISKGALVQKVEASIEEQKRLDANNIEDPDSIIRQSGQLSDDLLEEYAPANPTINNTKNRSGKTKFANNLLKAGNGLEQLGVAIHDIDLLNRNNLQTGYITPAISGISGAMGAGLGVVGTITGSVDTYRNMRNVSSGGSHLDWVSSGLDTLGSVGETATGALTAMKNAGNIPVIGQTLANASGFAGPNLIPGLNIATGGISMISGGIEGIRGQSSINTIDKQISALNGMKKGKTFSADQKKLMRIFNQGKRVSELHRTGGAIKTVGGAIALGTGVALLTGPLAPITAAVLGVAAGGAGITNFLYSRRKKKNLRKDVIAEELGFKDWEAEKKRVRDKFPDEDLSNDEVKEIILKSRGFDVKKRKEAFKQINKQRAMKMLDIADNVVNPLRTLAEIVIGALGISRKKGRYAAGAQKLLAEKMGG